MKIKKRITGLVTGLALAFSMAASLPAGIASAEPYDDYTYSVLTDGTVKITKYSGDETELEIPDEIDGMSVTAIGIYAFEDCPLLKSVTIPDSVTSIGHYAFMYCSSLESVTIPNSVTSIGTSAFKYCTSLESITIPDSMTSIGDWAFMYCTSLKSVTIPDSVISIANSAFWSCNSLESINVSEENQYYSSEDGCFFNKEKTKLIQYPAGNTRTSYSIPDSVTSLGNFAFDYCTSLESVTIPDSVITIGNYAFNDCSSLKSITIPESVTSIGNYAFDDCTSLESITISDSVTSVGSSAFSKTPFVCNQTTDVKYVGKWAVECDSDAVSVEIKKGTVGIIGYAFEECNLLESVTIPNSVTAIGHGAFYKCTSLECITIPDSVTNIDDEAFYGCTALESVTIPDSVTTIGYNAFYYCTALKSVTIPDSVTTIGAEAFGYYGPYGPCLLEGFVIYCLADSAAYTYAVENDIDYTIVDHIHSYGYPAIQSPTCTEDGWKSLICTICLESEIREILPATGHSYTQTVVEPTYTEQGYTLHVCQECGDSYMDNYTDMLEHDASSAVAPNTIYRQKTTAVDGYYAARFIQMVKKTDLENVSSITYTITDGTNTKTITGTSCFAAVMASGSTITADDGYVFIGVIVTGIPEEATLTCSMSLETAV